MAKAFDSWTVLPHSPIEAFSENLWRVSGTMPDGKSQRQMVLARMDDGGVVVHNAIALGDDEMTRVEAWGRPSILFVPNGWHRQDAAIWKQRYPDLVVVTPEGAHKKVAEVVRVDATTQEASGDSRVHLTPLAGLPVEGVLEVHSAASDTNPVGEVSIVFCDAVLNLTPQKGIMGLFLAPTGRVSVPRVVRWLSVKDTHAFADHLGRLAAIPGLKRLFFGHGEPVLDDAPAALRSVARQLRG